MIVALTSPEQERREEKRREQCGRRRREYEEIVSGGRVSEGGYPCGREGREIGVPIEPKYYASGPQQREEEDYWKSDRRPLVEYNPPKRGRFEEFGRVGNWSGGGQEQCSYVVGETTVLALKALFPSMSDETIADVLDKYGSDIDSAIRHLNELQLSTPGTSKVSLQAGEQEGRLMRDEHGGDGHVLIVNEEKQKGEEKQGEEEKAKSAEEWIELLVQHMSMSQSVEDAKHRASELLREFEKAVLKHSDVHVKMGELEKENALLKRAVGIQNSRIHELTAKAQGLEEMTRAFEALKEKCQNLELQNYSLQLHLKQATSTGDPMTPTQPNPDVF